jgi:hypothetical protein
MSHRVLAGLLLAAAAAGSGTSVAQTPDCSRATALEVAKEHFVWGPTVEDPLAQVLCGAFAGPGSTAMAVSFSAPTCWGPQGWAAYRLVGTTWEELYHVPLQFLMGDLVAEGDQIRETQPVHQAGDGRCFPTGGTRARNWRWDGSALVPGPWRQLTPPRRSAVVFATAPARGSCELVDDGTDAGSGVYCWQGSTGRAGPHAWLRPDGSFDRRTRRPIPSGLGGPTLAHGKQVTTGRFRCRSTRAGLRCVVRASSKGFVFGRRGAKRIGPRAAVSHGTPDHSKTPSGAINAV